MPTGTTSAGASVEEAIVLALFDLTNQLTKLGEELAGRVGLTTQQYLVLLHVAGDPNFTQSVHRGAPRRGGGVLPSEIAAARAVSRAAVSSLVAGLLRKGYARHVEHARDRRRKGLVTTGAGLRALASLEPARRKANRALLADLGAGRRRQLLGSLRACLDRLWEDGGAGASAAVGPPGERRPRKTSHDSGRRVPRRAAAPASRSRRVT
jgi:DNA-binding MarR family transcriptional regulator